MDKIISQKYFNRIIKMNKQMILMKKIAIKIIKIKLNLILKINKINL